MFVYEPMEMIGLKHITQEMSRGGAALQKSSGEHCAWDAVASSSECIVGLQSSRRGLRCKVSGACGSNGHAFMIGLTSVATMRDSVEYKSIAYAAHIDFGRFYVYESGEQIGEFGTVTAGDVIELWLTSNRDLPEIVYKVNGQTLYTSKQQLQAPLFVKVCAAYGGPLVEELQWILEPCVEQDGEVALTTGFDGIQQHRHTRALSKVQCLPGSAFNATVHSQDAIEDVSSDRIGLSFVVSQTESGTVQIFAVGFASDPEQGPSLESLAHAVHIYGRSLKVYEKGVLQGEIHHDVKAGDRIDMTVAFSEEESSEPKIEYYVNRQLLGEIRSEVHFPLYAKVCAKSPGALIEDLRWIDRNQQQTPRLRHLGSPSSNAAEELPLTVGEPDCIAARVRQLETTVSQLLAEVSTLKAASTQQAQLHEASLKEKALLEVQLEEKKAELVALKEASSAVIKEKCMQLAELKADRDSLYAATQAKPQVCAGNQESHKCMLSQQEEVPGLCPAMFAKSCGNALEDKCVEAVRKVLKQQTREEAQESLEVPQLGRTKPCSLEEELLALVVDKARLEIREMQLRHAVTERNRQVQSLPASVATASTSITTEQLLDQDLLAAMAQLRAQTAASLAMGGNDWKVAQLEMQQSMWRSEQQADNEAVRALIEDKAQLEMELKAVRAENEQLQQHQTKIEELHRQACQLFPTKAMSRSSDADSSEWEPLPPAATSA